MVELQYFAGDGRQLRFECKVCGYQQGKFTRFRSHIYSKHMNKIRLGNHVEQYLSLMLETNRNF